MRYGWPPPGTVAGAFRATFLILLVWATLAAMVTAVARRAAVGIPVAILLAMVEAYGAGLANLSGLPGAAAEALSQAFTSQGVPDLSVTARAAMLLSAYGVVFVVIAIAVLKRRT